MSVLAVWIGSILSISITGCFGTANTGKSEYEKEISLLRVGVPKRATEIHPKPAVDGFNRRRLRQIYRWPDREFCHYKFKVEAVTTERVAGDSKTSRHYLIFTLDHRTLDILEVKDSDCFFSDAVKFGRFIQSQSVWSCDRLRLEFMISGFGCRARDYRRTRVYSLEEEEEEEEEKVYVENWRWEAEDDECDSHYVTRLEP